MNTKKSEAAKINGFALLWWTVTVTIISVAYLLEVLKGERTIVYYVVLILFGVVPLLLGYWRYRVDPDTTQMKLFMAYGYTLLYTFVLLTGDTVLTFVFIFPILSTLVAYRDYKLLIKYAILNMIVNVISVVIKIVVFQMTDADKDGIFEIIYSIFSRDGIKLLLNFLYMRSNHSSNEASGYLRTILFIDCSSR